MKLHTVQTHLSAPANLLIQKTYVLFPLRTRTRTGTRPDQDRLTAGMWWWEKFQMFWTPLEKKKVWEQIDTLFWSQLKSGSLQEQVGLWPPTMDWYGGGGVKAQVNRERHMFVLQAETQWEGQLKTGRGAEQAGRGWFDRVQECFGSVRGGNTTVWWWWWWCRCLQLLHHLLLAIEAPPLVVTSFYMPILMLWMIWKIAAETKRWERETPTVSLHFNVFYCCLMETMSQQVSALFSGLCCFSFSNRVNPLFTNWSLSD